jgi:hypothetical protein
VNTKVMVLSVIISTWNRRNLVWQAIDSVIGQQYEGPLETVVVDDGSTDGTLDELSARYAGRTLPANRRLIIHSKPHTGITGTMGKGFELCSGDYVTMCNSDDLWEPVRAAELLAEVEKTPNAVVHTTCKTRMLDGFQLPGEQGYQHYREADNAMRAGGFTPLEYPGNVTLRDVLPYPRWERFYFRGALTIFPREFMQGDFAMPQGLLFEETWFLFAAMMQGVIRYADLNSYVQRIHGQNDSLPDASATRGLKRIGCNLAFMEHAIPILRSHATRDRLLVKRVETRARVDKYRLDINGGTSWSQALRILSLSDFLVRPREILSHTLSAKVPSFHDFLRRTRQRLTRKGPARQEGLLKPLQRR